MFNFGAATPINQNRTNNSVLFGNTSTQPSTLTSTPFSSTSFFGGTAATPSTSAIQPVSNGTAAQKFNPVEGTEKISKNGVQSQIRTKHFNICAMNFYEKKSMEELRLEDYAENRKFSSNSNSTSLFGTPTATTNLFGTSSNSTATPTPSLTTSIFGGPTTTSAPTLGFGFGSTPAATTTAAPLTFGSTATTTSTPSLFSAFGNPTTTITNAPSATPFAFGAGQTAPSSTSTASPFSFGGTTTSTAGTTFGFGVSKPTTTTTFSFTPSTAAITAAPAPNLGLFSAAAPTTTVATAAAAAPSTLFTSQTSVDTRTHLQLFQTMLNIHPFNSEMNFLSKNIKPNIGLDRTRLRTAPDTSTTNPLSNVFSPLLTKPSVLTANSTTPTSNPLPNHSHTLPSVLLPSNNSMGFLGKRKLADSFLDDDDEHFLAMDDGPTSSMTKLPKSQTNKRPRVLDMNKIRSVVLGGQTSTSMDLSRKIDENPSETFVVKTTPAEQMNGWKKFANYESYLASKNPTIELKTKIEEEKVTIKTFDQRRAFRLPRLTHDDYYSFPHLDDLRDHFNEQGQCFLKEFTVGRHHYGSVTFLGPKINLAGLDLDRLVEIGRRQVTVYPDDHDKPAEGEDLNCRAIISLLGVYPIDRSSSTTREEVTDPERLIQMDYGNYLREMTRKFQGQFIDYDVYTGTWKFQVDHF